MHVLSSRPPPSHILWCNKGFQAELDTKEDFLFRTQREKEPLSDFYQRFLQLKA
jgi:hypothetical protein